MLVFHHVRKLAALIVLVCAFVASGLTFAAPVQAATDTSGPVILNRSVTSTNLNHYIGPAVINISIRLADETGVETPTLIASWVNPDPCWWCGGGQSQGFGSMTLASGTTKDGIWKKTITIPKGAALGDWDVKLYPLSDTWGNRSSGFQTLRVVTVVNEKPVSPAAVAFSDKDGIKNDTYTVPVSTGVKYLKDGIVVPAGTYAAKDTVKIAARANPGYVLAVNAASTWTATFRGALIGSAPKITGSPILGSKLTANPGTWSPAPVVLRYQWFRSGVAITGATASTYALTTADLGKTITVRVTASKVGYAATPKNSLPTKSVTRT